MFFLPQKLSYNNNYKFIYWQKIYIIFTKHHIKQFKK